MPNDPISNNYTLDLTPSYSTQYITPEIPDAQAVTILSMHCRRPCTQCASHVGDLIPNACSDYLLCYTHVH